MNILKSIICKFKGHDVDSEQSIIDGYIMINHENWICKCKRCGLYLMHDGAVTGQTLVVSKKEAYKLKHEIENDMLKVFERKLVSRV